MTDEQLFHELDISQVVKQPKTEPFEVTIRKTDKKTNKEIETKTKVNLTKFVLEDKDEKLLDKFLVIDPYRIAHSRFRNGLFRRGSKRDYKAFSVKNYHILEEDSLKTFSRIRGKGKRKRWFSTSKKKRSFTENRMHLGLPVHVKVATIDLTNRQGTHRNRGSVVNITEIRSGRHSLLVRPENHRFVVNCGFSQNVKLDGEALRTFKFKFDFVHFAKDTSVYGDCTDYHREVLKKLNEVLERVNIDLKKFKTFGCKPKSIFLQTSCGHDASDDSNRVDFDRQQLFKVDGEVKGEEKIVEEDKMQYCDIKLAFVRHNTNDLCINYDNGNQFVITNYYGLPYLADLQFNKIPKEHIFAGGVPFICNETTITGSELGFVPVDDPIPVAKARHGWNAVRVNSKRNIFDFFQFSDIAVNQYNEQSAGKLVKFALYNLPNTVKWLVNDKELTSKELTNLAMDKKNEFGLSLLNNDGDKGILFDPAAVDQNTDKPNIKLLFKKVGKVKVAVGCMDNAFQLSKKAKVSINVLPMRRH